MHPSLKPHFIVRLHTPPTAHLAPHERPFDTLDAFFKWYTDNYQNSRNVLIWIKDDLGAVHYGYIDKDTGALRNQHGMAWNNDATLHESSAYKEAEARSKVPVKVKLAD